MIYFFSTRSVQVHSCQYSTPDRVHKEEVMASHFVLNIIDSLRHLNKLKMSPESVSFETFRKWGKCKGKTADFFIVRFCGVHVERTLHEQECIPVGCVPAAR